jgi:ribose transport system substrate-binding protein
MHWLIKGKRWLGLAAVAVVITATMVTGFVASAQGGAAKHWKITFIAGDKGDPFYITLDCGAVAEAKKEGATVNMQAPATFSPTDQTPIVDAVAAAKPDALLIAPTDAKAMYTPIKQVANEGVKIVFVDTTLANPSMAVAQVHTDDFEGGQAAAKILYGLVGGKGKKVMLLNFIPGVSTTEARGKGFVSEAKKLGLNVVAQQYGGQAADKSASIVEGMLARYPDLAGIFTTTDFGAEGTVTALRAADDLGKVKVVGFDASPIMVSNLKAKDIQAIVAQQARKIGQVGVQQAIRALTGKPTTKMTALPTLTVTTKNINSAKSKAVLQQLHC